MEAETTLSQNRPAGQIGEKTMKRSVIIGGADIHQYGQIRAFLRADDFFIYCDSGLKHMEALAFRPNLIIGDFDSHENPHMDVETIVLPCEKDDTDTVFAVKEAIRRGFEEILLIGVIGGRLDHTLGNVSILLNLAARGIKGLIVDDYSEMEIIPEGETALVEDRYPFFSLLNISGTAEQVTIENATYNLKDATSTCEYQYGVSNEVLPGKIARITVGKGKLLLIRDR